ncbi:MAG: hypothetical protein RL473_1475, partial [Actinomycetota bacterium]
TLVLRFWCALLLRRDVGPNGNQSVLEGIVATT